MVTEGIIQSIDYNSNVCMVRVPLFDSSQGATKMALQAHFIAQPGTCNGYKENDLVWLCFESDLPHKPLIMGKIYTSMQEELANSSNAISCNTITCSGSANLPEDTRLKDAIYYKTIRELSSEVYRLKNMLSGDFPAQILASNYTTYLYINLSSTPLWLTLRTSKNYTTFDDLISNMVMAGHVAANALLPVKSLKGQNIIGLFVEKVNENYELRLVDSNINVISNNIRLLEVQSIENTCI